MKLFLALFILLQSPLASSSPEEKETSAATEAGTVGKSPDRTDSEYNGYGKPKNEIWENTNPPSEHSDRSKGDGGR